MHRPSKCRMRDDRTGGYPDPETHAVLRLLGELYAAAIAGRPGLCLLCDNELAGENRPAGLVLMHAYCEDAAVHAVGHGLCPECFGNNDRAQLGPAIIRKYRETMIPDAREIPLPSAPGHA